MRATARAFVFRLQRGSMRRGAMMTRLMTRQMRRRAECHVAAMLPRKERRRYAKSGLSYVSES